METEQKMDDNQKGLENLILLVIGSKKKPMSILHLEKELFIIWNFHPSIKIYLHFIKHYRGPYSPEITETIRDPVYLYDCWKYMPPKKDYISGGYVKITVHGLKEYKRLNQSIKNQNDVLLLHLLNSIDIVRQLYDQLDLDELLLLIYDSYPDFIRYSEEYAKINQNRVNIANKLKDKQIIDSKKYISLIEAK